MLKAILFDWDDVVTLGSKDGYFACYHKALEAVGVELDPEEEKKRILSKWGETHKDELKELLKEHPEKVDEAAEVYTKELFGDTYVDELYILPGMLETLLELSKKYKVAIATGIHPDILFDRVIPKFNIPSFFHEMISSYEIKDPSKRKPDPYTAIELMKRLDVLPEETIVVGDAENDMLMAKSAGCTPIAVLSGLMDEQKVKELDIQLVLPDIRSLRELIETHFA